MTCDTCKTGGANAAVDYEKRGRQRIAALQACEPWCGGGGCPTGRRADLPPLYTFLRDLGAERLRKAGFELCKDDSGRLGVRPVSPATGKHCGPCIPLESCDECAEFGPHANAARRRPDLSPTDIKAIASGFNWESMTLGPQADPLGNQQPITRVPGSGDWFIAGSPSLGVSHRFCVHSLSAFISPPEGAPIVNVPITGVRLAGARIACEAGPTGAYTWVVDFSTAANPTNLRVTEYRCECDDLCKWTPEQGWEFIMFQAPTLDLVDIPSTTLRVEVSRDDWLVEVDDCVSALSNRFLMYAGFLDPSGFAFNPNVTRTVAGQIPFIP